VGAFFATRLFFPDRAALLAAQLPATDAAQRDTQTAGLQARRSGCRDRAGLSRSSNSSSSLPTPQPPPCAPASAPASPACTTNASRSRPSSRPGQDHPGRRRPGAAGPVPARRGYPGRPAAALKARLFAALGLEVLWNKPGQQATVFVEITDATPTALPGILDLSHDGYHDTSTSEPAPSAPSESMVVTTYRIEGSLINPTSVRAAQHAVS
jgi:hypothetical protein